MSIHDLGSSFHPAHGPSAAFARPIQPALESGALDSAATAPEISGAATLRAAQENLQADAARTMHGLDNDSGAASQHSRSLDQQLDPESGIAGVRNSNSAANIPGGRSVPPAAGPHDSASERLEYKQSSTKSSFGSASSDEGTPNHPNDHSLGGPPSNGQATEANTIAEQRDYVLSLKASIGRLLTGRGRNRDFGLSDDDDEAYDGDEMEITWTGNPFNAPIQGLPLARPVAHRGSGAEMKMKRYQDLRRVRQVRWTIYHLQMTPRTIALRGATRRALPPAS